MSFPLDERFLLEAEETLGAPLPICYRAALLENNGGVVDCDDDRWRLDPVWDKSDRKRLKRTANHILAETLAMQAWVGWPKEALRIAANGTGDALLFLREAGAFLPTVHRWHHETAELRTVAPDFSALPRRAR